MYFNLYRDSVPVKAKTKNEIPFYAVLVVLSSGFLQIVEKNYRLEGRYDW